MLALLCPGDTIQILLILSQFLTFGTETKLEGLLYNRLEHSRGFFICFVIKNRFISTRIHLHFQNKLIFPNEQKWRPVFICTLIKHAKISQSQSLLEWFE